MKALTDNQRKVLMRIDAAGVSLAKSDMKASELKPAFALCQKDYADYDFKSQIFRLTGLGRAMATVISLKIGEIS